MSDEESVELEGSSSSAFSDRSVSPRSPLSDFRSGDPIAWSKTPVGRYECLAVAVSVLGSLNAYRKSCNCAEFVEDPTLCSLSMRHSQRMAAGKTPFAKEALQQELAQHPFPFSDVRIAQYSARDSGLVNAISGWMADPVTVGVLVGIYDCAGAGYAVSGDGTGYFTVVFAIRSIIGNSYYCGVSLGSLLYAQKCLSLLNCVRAHSSQLRAIKFSEELADLAHRFIAVEGKIPTKELLVQTIGRQSAIGVAVGKVPTNAVAPQMIVSEWVNQVSRQSTFFGDFNRIGIAIKKDGDSVISLVLLVRSVRSALVDGTEKVVDPVVIGGEVIDIFNRFRGQHQLQPLVSNELLMRMSLSHTVYVANGQVGDNPLTDAEYVRRAERLFEAVDVSHFSCPEMSLAPQRLVAKWRMNADCISVLLNDVSDIGVGVAFDDGFVCHMTVIIGSRGEESQVTNRIVRF
jgi:uncharacterized protein YkwD